MAKTDNELQAEIEHSFTNQAPDPNKDVIGRFEYVRAFFKDTGRAVVEACPVSEERDEAVRFMDIALTRAIASIARHQDMLN